jgi:hypothetical protein
MKVLPFYLKQKKGQLEMTNLTVFLANNGKSLWQTEEQTVSEKELLEEYLKPNGFSVKKIHQNETIYFVEIDPQATNLSDFYRWEETFKLQQRVECWRSFYFFKDAINADWFTGKQQQESEIEGRSIHEYYEDILRHSV